MKRYYESGESDDVMFFVGIEVEKTPAYGMKTLFVVGLHSFESIYEKTLFNGCKHIFFGANHSFNPAYNNADEWRAWEKMISAFLEKDFWCTLDIPLSAVEEFNDGGLNNYNNFIPQIRIPIPYLKLWNYNTMIKIDDKDFDSTNPGVWTHSLQSLMSRDTFTNWFQYKNDEVIK